MKSRTCPMCGDVHNRTAPLCQSCYMYMRKHPEGRYSTPPKGVIAVANNGDIICHVCGYAYRTLDGHINQKHGMTHNGYCDKFKLYRSTKLCNKDYREFKSRLQQPYRDKVVNENLIIKGVATRFQPGQVIERRGYHIKLDYDTLKGGE